MTLFTLPAPAKGLTAGNYRPNLLERFSAVRRPYELLHFERAAVITQNVIVPDVSFYQDKNTTLLGIDFNQMAMAGARGVIVRAGQNLWVDEDFIYNWLAAKNAGVPRGAYWFLDPRVKPQDQADKFSELIYTHGFPELDLWADYEAPDSWGGAYAGYDGLYNFLERLRANLSDVKISIYTGYYYWLAHSPPTIASLNYFKAYPLAEAWYTTNPADVRIPAPWTALTWWQWTDNGNGPLYGAESLNIDLNYFNGTPEEYKLYFGLDYGNVEPPPNGGDMPEIEVRSKVPSETRSIRNGHGIKFTKVDDLPPGGVATSHGETDDIYVYPADAPDSTIPGGFSARAGDKWIRVYKVGGTPLPTTHENWLAVIHLRVEYTLLTTIPEPSPVPSELNVDLTVVDGKLSGTVAGVDISGAPFNHVL